VSLVVLGLSHHEAPLSLLESVALGSTDATGLEAAVLRSEHVSEAVVLSTCNRTEVYAEAETFHGAVADVGAALAEATGHDRADLKPHLYVHYEERGVAHAFAVTAGLDSMAVGEAQVVGQMRRSLARAQDAGHVGPALNALLQQALRVAKRVHHDTGIDRVGGSLVQAALVRAAGVAPLAEQTVLVIGAGGMGSLAATAAARAGVAAVLVANRDHQRARRVAARVSGRPVRFGDLGSALASADLVIASTGAPGRVVSHDDVRTAQAARAGRQQVYVDLALPHDIDRSVATLPGVSRVGLDELGADLAGTTQVPEVMAAREVVTAEVASYLLARGAASVAPTVTALRGRADLLVAAELDRLERRTPGLSGADRAEVRWAVERIIDKLLHAPTVRVQQLAREGRGVGYAQALSELFDLDPRDVSLVSTPAQLPDLTEETP
jgi:glutamyl-tRNA reductase